MGTSMRSIQFAALIVMASASTADAGLLGSFLQDRVFGWVDDAVQDIETQVQNIQSHIDEQVSSVQSEVEQAVAPIIEIHNIIDDIANLNVSEIIGTRIDNIVSDIEMGIDSHIDEVFDRFPIPDLELPSRQEIIELVLENHESLEEIVDFVEPIISHFLDRQNMNDTLTLASATAAVSSLASQSLQSEPSDLLSEIVESADDSSQVAAATSIGTLANAASSPAATVSSQSLASEPALSSLSTGAVPEPGTFMLVMLALGAMATLRVGRGK
jgi:hypothetical protein